jgi:hypothetical protein
MGRVSKEEELLKQLLLSLKVFDIERGIDTLFYDEVARCLGFYLTYLYLDGTIQSKSLLDDKFIKSFAEGVIETLVSDKKFIDSVRRYILRNLDNILAEKYNKKEIKKSEVEDGK